MIGVSVVHSLCFVDARPDADGGLAEKEISPGAAVETEEQFRGMLRQGLECRQSN